MLLFSTARLDKTLVTILSCYCLNTAVGCKIQVHASIGRTDFHTCV